MNDYGSINKVIKDDTQTKRQSKYKNKEQRNSSPDKSDDAQPNSEDSAKSEEQVEIQDQSTLEKIKN